MEEIEIGEYVRNEDGYIQKITSFDKQTNIYKHEKGELRIWEGEDVFGNEYSSKITKHSKNIIDLIEVGDYVNGYKVYRITGYYVSVESFEKYILCFDEQDIKTILTHEIYENNCYRLEE